jgi:hypothetical protein
MAILGWTSPGGNQWRGIPNRWRRGSVVGILQLNPQTVGDAVDVGVVGSHLDDVQYIDVAEAGGEQALHICSLHCGRRTRQLDRVAQHGEPPIVEAGALEVVLDPCEQSVVSQEPAQTAPVMHASVLAGVLVADNEGYELALNLAQALRAAHHGLVQRHVRRQPRRVQGVDGHDVVELAAV